MPGRDWGDAGALLRWEPVGEGRVRLFLAREGVGELALARNGSVRLRLARGETLEPEIGPAIGREPWEAAPAAPYPVEGGGVGLAFEGPEGSARAELQGPPLRLRVSDREGLPLAELEGFGFAASGDGARASLRVRAQDHLYGLGETSGPLEQRGRRVPLRNRDPGVRLAHEPLYLGIPLVLRLGRDETGAVRGVGWLVDVAAPLVFDLARADPERVQVEAASSELDLWIFPGPTPREVLRRYTAYTGRSPRPPRWALGYHQSRWSYASEKAVRTVARELRRRRIPADAIHLDIDFMDGFRVFTWHPRRFPDPKGLASELAAEGFHLVAIVDPGVKVDPDWIVFAEARERGLFCRREDGRLYTLKVWPGDAALPDFARPEVRAWWSEQHRSLLEAGVAGIWNDMNEPAGWRSEIRLGKAILPYRGQDTRSLRQAHPGDPERSVPHERLRNVYGQLECRATREAFERFAPDRRPFVLTRSGFAGIQRYAAVWTGDSWSTWSDLRRSVRMLLGLSLSGVPFCGADIGGFAGPCRRELFARWIQIGALYPFARTHSWWLHPRQEPWRFGRRVEAIAREALRLRMRLLPYLYTLFCRSEAAGEPVWRALAYEFPDDEEAAAIDDQVMIGPWLLAAPVLEPRARERELYLPAGVWYAFADDARYVGPRRLRVAAPLERLPLFVRAGAVLPTQSPTLHTAEPPREPLVLEVFPGSDGELELVEDDGATLAYRRGEEARTRMRLRSQAGGRLRLELATRAGRYAIAPRSLRVRVHACPRPRQVRLDAVALPEAGPDGAPVPSWSWRDARLDVRLLESGRPLALEVEPAP